MRFKYRVEYALLQGVSWLLGWLPFHVAMALGSGLARLSWSLSKKRRRRTLRRMRAVLGSGFSNAELERMARDAWGHFFHNTIEVLLVPRTSREEIIARMPSNLVTPVREKVMREGRGVVVAVAHLGCWDMAGIALGAMGMDIMAIARIQRNPLINQWIHALRSHTGLDPVEIAGSARVGSSIVRRLQKGALLAILPDIRAKRDAVRVRFLGADADLPKGMAFFARAAGVPILPVAVSRRSDLQHDWMPGTPIWPDLSMDAKTDYQRMTQHVMDFLDAAIRRDPSQYFWFNKRWVLGEEP